MNRTEAIRAFLADAGFGGAMMAPLAQDASFRRYFRVSGGKRPAVLMDAPPPEDVRPFLRIAEHLARAGISVPEIIAADEGSGLVLEEDLGDSLLPAVMSDETTPALFDAAVEVLAVMQRRPPPDGLPRWDAAAMRDTALATFCDWWWPACFGAPCPDAARADFADALDRMLTPLAGGPVCFVHRDFFSGNLIWRPDRPGLRRVGVIDFQGAALGHPAYDLASLVQDARRDIPAAVADRAVARLLALRPELDASDFRSAFAICAAQRHFRVAAQWVRLARRDGRPQYLVHGPRTWGLLERGLQAPEAAPLSAVMDRRVPTVLRGNPKDLAA